jgi:hypothetical protein
VREREFGLPPDWLGIDGYPYRAQNYEDSSSMCDCWHASSVIKDHITYGFVYYCFSREKLESFYVNKFGQVNDKFTCSTTWSCTEIWERGYVLIFCFIVRNYLRFCFSRRKLSWFL